MKKKIFCIAIVSMFLLVSVNVVSKPTNKIKEDKLETKEIEKQISNVKLKDCPCQNKQSNSDPELPLWYPGKCIICNLIWIISIIPVMIKTILTGDLPWVILAIGEQLGCWWAEWS